MDPSGASRHGRTRLEKTAKKGSVNGDRTLYRNQYKVAVVGGGVAGLTAAYELLKGGANVTLYEKEGTFGGLASSFSLDNGYLERYYHFICLNDKPYFKMLGELGIDGLLCWRLTKMGQFYNGRLYSFGDPWDLLFFRPLSWADRLRFGLGIMAIKGQSPDAWRKIEDETVEEWLVGYFGRRTYEVLYKPLVEMKFGSYASNLSAAWMWARIHRLGKSRTRLLQLEKLGYLKGGTNVLIEALTKRIQNLGGRIMTRRAVQRVFVDKGKVKTLACDGEQIAYDAILSTIPMPSLTQMLVGPGSEQLAKLNHIESIGVTCLVLRLKQPYSRFFWTNISDSRIPFLGVIEYSNLNPSACRNGDCVVYIPHYLPSNSPWYKVSDEEILYKYQTYMKLIRADFDKNWVRDWRVFRDQYAQPICTVGFTHQIAGIKSVIKKLYITDSHQLHPDDRTVSNSIDLGRKAAKLMLREREER